MKKVMIRKNIKQWLTGNWAARGMALVLTLVVWVVLTEQEDLILTHEMHVEFITSQELVLEDKGEQVVWVNVSGPRSSLKSYVQENPLILIDLTSYRVGWVQLPLTESLLDLPAGVKFLRIYPELIEVQLKKKE